MGSAARTQAACAKSVRDELSAREWEPTYRAAEYVAEARERMGETRWQELNQEWDK